MCNLFWILTTVTIIVVLPLNILSESFRMSGENGEKLWKTVKNGEKRWKIEEKKKRKKTVKTVKNGVKAVKNCEQR